MTEINDHAPQITYRTISMDADGDTVERDFVFPAPQDMSPNSVPYMAEIIRELDRMGVRLRSLEVIHETTITTVTSWRNGEEQSTWTIDEAETFGWMVELGQRKFEFTYPAMGVVRASGNIGNDDCVYRFTSANAQKGTKS